jgi:hypothetical protein
MTSAWSHVPAATKELDRLTVDAGLDGDRLAGLARQSAEQTGDDEGGVGPLLDAVAARQVGLQGRGAPILAASDLVRCHDGVGQEDLGFGVIHE